MPDKDMPAILVTGGSGQVGTELQQRMRGRFDVAAPSRAEMDLSDPDAVAAYAASRPWAAIVSSGAYTAVDKAESDVLTAWKVNALAPAALAVVAAAQDIPLIHLSTDYVFDGSKPAPYLEGDPLAPLGVYGASKLGGEMAVRTTAPRHVILRTAWVVSPHGVNFIRTMLRLAETRDRLGVVDDQRGCPTAAGDIAEAVLALVDRMTGDRDAATGTYHFVNAGEATWCELARHVFARSAEAGGKTPTVDAITTADYPTPARRPANSRLDTGRITRDFGLRPRPWRDAVDDVLAQLLGDRANGGPR